MVTTTTLLEQLNSDRRHDWDTWFHETSERMGREVEPRG